jgi:hypothetical protein
MPRFVKIVCGIVAAAVLAVVITPFVLQRSLNEYNVGPVVIRLPSPDAPTLTFPITMLDQPMTVAMSRPIHYDFWFENRNAVPIELALNYGSCKCVDIAFCLFTPEQNKRYRVWGSAAAAARVTSTVGGIFSVATQLEVEPKMMSRWTGFQPEWRTLEIDGEPTVIVAPGQGGLIRLSVKYLPGRRGLGRHAVGLGTRISDGSGAPWTIQRLELPYVQVNSPRDSTTDAEAGATRSGEG